MRVCGMDSNNMGYGPVVGASEPSGSINGGEFLDQQSECRIQ
jgi:hypothetical protein